MVSTTSSDVASRFGTNSMHEKAEVASIKSECKTDKKPASVKSRNSIFDRKCSLQPQSSDKPLQSESTQLRDILAQNTHYENLVS